MHHTFLALLPFSGRARLRPDRSLPGLIRKTDMALRAVPREDLPPAGTWVEDHSRLLMDEAEALCRDARGWPALPADERREPRVLRWARRTMQDREGAADAALLEQAGLLLSQVYQNMPPEELELNSIYLEYCSLIDQSVTITEPEQPATEQPVVQNILAWFRTIFTVVLNWLLRVF